MNQTWWDMGERRTKLMKSMVVGGVVVLTFFLVGAGPLGSATLATASAGVALAPGSGILMLLGAGLLGVSRRWR